MSKTNKDTKSAIGKGIRALLNNIDEDLKSTHLPLAGEGDVSAIEKAPAVSRIPLDKIVVNPKQPRTDFDEDALKELSESIALHDIIQPITVISMPNGTYQIISGERRFRASKLAGLVDVPAYVRTANEQEQLELALIENLQREDLNAIEIARSYKMLMDEAALTQEELAARMNKDRSTITNYLRLLKLPPDIQKAVRDKALSMGHARALVGLEMVDHQLYVFREIKEKGLSVRQTEQLVKSLADESADKAKVKSNSSTVLSPAYKKIEQQISSKFSTKVKMDRKKAGYGSITIHFYNDDDLERIIEELNL